MYKYEIFWKHLATGESGVKFTDQIYSSEIDLLRALNRWNSHETYLYYWTYRMRMATDQEIEMHNKYNCNQEYMRKHIERFFKLNCAPQIMSLSIFPNAKEITESMSAHDMTETYILPKIDARFKDSDIACVVVGDGVSPRTGSMFAFRSNWSVWSIDPKMRKIDWNIKRLTCQARKIEDEVLDLMDFSQVIVIMVHSHANLKNTIKYIKAKRMHILTIPCCVKHDIPNIPFIGIKDINIWSEKNDVKIWLNIGE